MSAEGTPADLTRVTTIPARGSQVSAFVKAMKVLNADELRPQGYKWFRVSSPDDDETHVYLEAWLQKPEKEGELDRAAAIKVGK